MAELEVVVVFLRVADFEEDLRYYIYLANGLESSIVSILKLINPLILWILFLYYLLLNFHF